MESVSSEFTAFEHRVTGVIYFIVGFLGVSANIVTLLIFKRYSPLHGNKNTLHVQLTLANIMVVICFPFSGLSAFNGKWLFGDLGCKLYGLWSYIGGMGAPMFATLLCIERYFAIGCWTSDRSTSIAAMGLVAVLGWAFSIGIAVGPVIGWNRYTIEECGTACGLDWRDGDSNIFLVLLLIAVLMAVVAILALWATFSYTETMPETNKEDWFTENSLNWIALANFSIVMIGFAPYGVLAMRTVIYGGQQLSMLASVIPPLAAKASTSFCPVVYCVSSKQFREAFTAMTIGASVPKKIE